MSAAPVPAENEVGRLAKPMLANQVAYNGCQVVKTAKVQLDRLAIEGCLRHRRIAASVTAAVTVAARTT